MRLKQRHLDTRGAFGIRRRDGGGISYSQAAIRWGALVALCSALTAALHAQAPASSQTAADERLGLLEAVRLTLAQDPTIRLQELQTNVARGAWQEASGQFDVTLDTTVQKGLTRTPRTELERFQTGVQTNANGDLEFVSTQLPGVLAEDVTNYRLGLSKQLRSGPTLSSGVELTRFADNLDQRRAVNRANLNFVIHVPLLKGFGRAATDALEMAAKVRYEAEGLELHHTITARILNTASAYWNCVSAQRQLEILRETEARARDLAARVSDLIDAGEVAASELKQVQADLAQKTAARIAAEQRLTQARQSLALAIGRSLKELPTAPLPGDRFPSPPTNAAPPAFQGQAMIEQCLNRRADYQAALKTQKAAEILLRAARRNLKPQLDFELEVGYASLDEGSQFRRFYGALDPRDFTGLNTMGTLRLQWPFGNNAARGQFVQREAAEQQSVVRAQDLARSVTSGVLVALDELQQTLAELRKAIEAAKYYREAEENEREKLKIAASTVIDVITIADRRSDAELNEVSALARFALTVARVRFETGLLVSIATAPAAVLSQEDLITIPTAELIQSAATKP